MSKKPKQIEQSSKNKVVDPLEGKKIKPLNGHVLIELLRKDSSIYVPSDLKDREFQGKVVAVADEVKDYKAGDFVIFEKFADSSIDRIPYGKDGDNVIEVTLINQKLIMGVWE